MRVPRWDVYPASTVKGRRVELEPGGKRGEREKGGRITTDLQEQLAKRLTMNSQAVKNGHVLDDRVNQTGRL